MEPENIYIKYCYDVISYTEYVAKRYVDDIVFDDRTIPEKTRELRSQKIKKIYGTRMD